MFKLRYRIWDSRTRIQNVEKAKEKPDYEQIISGNIQEKLEVARIFMEQIKTHERLLNEKISWRKTE